MRCIFCKKESSNSRSAEHIIPESLGNTKHLLSRGIVCDSCNNYFSREVEKPFLESPAIKALRFHQAIPSKKGRVPPIEGLLDPGISVTLYRYLKGPFFGSIDVNREAFEQIMSSEQGRVIFPISGEAPKDLVVSRFLAKAGIEAIAYRLSNYPEGLDYLVDEVQFDPARNHARRGDSRQWPHYARRIYDADKKWNTESDDSTQVMHEFDFLQTEAGELYFVVAIFGLELTLNIGGPFIDGYINWLKQHNQASPLYLDNRE